MNWGPGLVQVTMTKASEPHWKLTPRQGMPASFMSGLHPGSGWSHQYSSADIGGYYLRLRCCWCVQAATAQLCCWSIALSCDSSVVSWIQPQGQAGMTSLQHSTVASVESHEHSKNRLSEQTTLSLMHRGHQLTPPELGLHHCCCQGTSQQISARRQCQPSPSNAFCPYHLPWLLNP